MTQDEIIEMAKQGGFSYLAVQTPNDLIAFAKLVAAKEREACASVADEWIRAYPHPSKVIAERIRKRG